MFKALNIRGEIRFGKDPLLRRDVKLSRVNGKLNKLILEKELKRERLEKAYRNKKINASEFFKSLEKLH